MKLISPLQAFIFASAGFHVGLILISDSPDLVLPGTSGSAMSVKLKEPIQKVSHPITEKNPAKKISNTVTHTQTKNSLAKVATHKKEKQPQTSSAVQENSVSKAHVVSIIYKQLNNHFNYPKIAQRRNWQGQVLLAFRLTKNGNIKDIKINHSSGYNILDQAAIIALQKIGQLPQLSSWLSSGMEIQIPIIYQLTEG